MNIREKIEALLQEYLDAPEAWSDSVVIEVNPASLDARLRDEEEVDMDSDVFDYWPVMDFLLMSVENPGEWKVDPEAVSELVSSYD